MIFASYDKYREETLAAIIAGARVVSDETLAIWVIYLHGLVHNDVYDAFVTEAKRREIEEEF